MKVGKKGQISQNTPMIVMLIIVVIMAALGAQILSDIGNQDTTTTTYRTSNQQITSVITNSSLNLNQTGIVTSSFTVRNSTNNATISSGNYTITSAGVYTYTGVLFNNTNHNFTYNYNVIGGAPLNTTRGGALALENYSSLLTVAGTILAAILIIGLIAGTLAILRKF